MGMRLSATAPTTQAYRNIALPLCLSVRAEAGLATLAPICGPMLSDGRQSDSGPVGRSGPPDAAPLQSLPRDHGGPQLGRFHRRPYLGKGRGEIGACGRFYRIGSCRRVHPAGDGRCRSAGCRAAP